MNKIVKFYNRNRYMIWTVILTIVGVILINKALVNNYNEYKINNKGRDSISTISSGESYSIVTEEMIDTEKSKDIGLLIDSFMNYCNNKNIEEAYNLISDDCKKELFNNDINMFINNYYNKIFTGDIIYSIQAWITGNIGYTYQVEMAEDILTTGGKSSYLKITDYFTIIDQNGEYKLNINNYIGNERLNIEGTQDNITIKILNKRVYKEYEIYEIEFQNKNNFAVLLDTKQKDNTTYMEGINGQKYEAFMNEITDYELQLKSSATRILKIKFNKSYNPKYVIKGLKFTSIILNYQNDINVGRNIIEIVF